jgi:2,4-dienoyl-CoA reductase-like NADH-dependent reductase (Old Yellow Enzyme family)
MTLEDIALVIEQFGEAAKRAIRAGFDAIEIHSAHGYLLHEFLSPISNKREDAYGGDFASRTRFVLDVVGKLRSVLPETMPLFVRISASDWIEGGWDLASSVRLSVLLEERGVDFIDVSSGGLSPEQTIELGPGYQMPFASAISKAVAIPTGTVGLITDAHQAEEALDDGVADVVLMGRQFLREPSYALRAAPELGAELPWPGQYERARPV